MSSSRHSSKSTRFPQSVPSSTSTTPATTTTPSTVKPPLSPSYRSKTSSASKSKPRSSSTRTKSSTSKSTSKSKSKSKSASASSRGRSSSLTGRLNEREVQTLKDATAQQDHTISEFWDWTVRQEIDKLRRQLNHSMEQQQQPLTMTTTTTTTQTLPLHIQVLQEVLSKRESIVGRNNQVVAETYKTMGQMYIVSAVLASSNNTSRSASQIDTSQSPTTHALFSPNALLPKVLPIIRNIPNVTAAAASSLLLSSVLLPTASAGDTVNNKGDDDDDNNHDGDPSVRAMTKAVGMFRTHYRIQVVLRGTSTVSQSMPIERSDLAVAMSALSTLTSSSKTTQDHLERYTQYNHFQQMVQSMYRSVQHETDGDTLRRFLQLPKAVVEYQKAARIEQLVCGVGDNPDLCYLWRKIACLTSIRHMNMSHSGSSNTGGGSSGDGSSRNETRGDSSSNDDVSISTDESSWEVCDRVSGKWFRHQPKGSLYPRVCSVIKKGDDYYKSQRYDDALKEYWKAATIKIAEDSTVSNEQQGVSSATSGVNIITPTGQSGSAHIRQGSTKKMMVISTSSHSTRSVFSKEKSQKHSPSIRVLIQKELVDFLSTPDSRAPILPKYYPPPPPPSPSAGPLLSHQGNLGWPGQAMDDDVGEKPIQQHAYTREDLDRKMKENENKPSDHSKRQRNRRYSGVSTNSESTEEMSNLGHQQHVLKSASSHMHRPQQPKSRPHLEPPTTGQRLQTESSSTHASSQTKSESGRANVASSSLQSLSQSNNSSASDRQAEQLSIKTSRSHDSNASSTNQPQPPLSSAGGSTFRPLSASSQIGSATTPVQPPKKPASVVSEIKEEEGEDSGSHGFSASAEGFDDSDPGLGGIVELTRTPQPGPPKSLTSAKTDISLAASYKETPQTQNTLKRGSSFSYVKRIASRTAKSAKKKTGRTLQGLSQSIHKLDMGLGIGGKKNDKFGLMEDVSMSSLGYDVIHSHKNEGDGKESSTTPSPPSSNVKAGQTKAADSNRTKKGETQIIPSDGDVNDDQLPQKPTRRKSFEMILSPIPPTPVVLRRFVDAGGIDSDDDDEESIDIIPMDDTGRKGFDADDEESDSTTDQTLKERFINTSSVVVNLLETMKAIQTKRRGRKGDDESSTTTTQHEEERRVITKTLIELVENVQDMSAILQRQTFRLHIVINDGKNVSGTTEGDFIDSINRTAEDRTTNLTGRSNEALCDQIDQIFEECDEILSLAMTTSDAAASQQQEQNSDGMIYPRLDECVKTFALEQTFVQQLRKGYALQSASILGHSSLSNVSSGSSSVTSGESFATEEVGKGVV